MKKLITIISGILFAMLVLSSCSEEWPPNGGGNEEPGIVPVGKYIGDTGCKNEIKRDTPMTGDNSQDCISWKYSDNMVLDVKHVNAGFNCCPEPKNLTINVKGNIITIDETDAQQGCYCLCLYDVDYRITGLKPGIYDVIVMENLIGPDQEMLKFVIDLKKQPAGEYYVTRLTYPWNID